MKTKKRKSFFDFFRFFLREKKRKISPGSMLLTGQPCEELKKRLEELMDKRKPFLQPGYCIRDLAKDMDIPAYQLSAFINQVMGMNFNDYINNSRVRYCEQIMKNSLITKPIVKDLSQLCGFNNRNSFTTAFKKFTGQTPSDYVRYHL